MGLSIAFPLRSSRVHRKLLFGKKIKKLENAIREIAYKHDEKDAYCAAFTYFYSIQGDIQNRKKSNNSD
tara:strand:+ start:285817 stop:286023 length:207 start_codon:yes stop_codon:yes gene_type:complete